MDRWYSFMKTNEFVVVINIVRILTFIIIGIILIVLIKEIEAIKLLAYDPCAICINKTGCNCFCVNLFK